MTEQPTPETDAKLADDTQPSSDSPDYVRALEIHIHLLRAELAGERAKKSDALIAAHNDALLRLHVTTAERDDARADVARLRAALEGMMEVDMRQRKSEGWGADHESHRKAARAALATSAQ